MSRPVSINSRPADFLLAVRFAAPFLAVFFTLFFVDAAFLADFFFEEPFFFEPFFPAFLAAAFFFVPYDARVLVLLFRFLAITNSLKKKELNASKCCLKITAGSCLTIFSTNRHFAICGNAKVAIDHLTEHS